MPTITVIDDTDVDNPLIELEIAIDFSGGPFRKRRAWNAIAQIGRYHGVDVMAIPAPGYSKSIGSYSHKLRLRGRVEAVDAVQYDIARLP